MVTVTTERLPSSTPATKFLRSLEKSEMGSEPSL